MRIPRFAFVVGAAVLGLSLFAWAQSRRPGLYEITANMTWQQSPFPANMPAMPAGHSPFGGGPHTSQVCVTQEQIDKYGTPPPQTRGGCEVTNIDKKPNGMTAEMVCSGQFSGKGTIEASWTDAEHSTSKVHFVGAMQMGPNSKPIEWTMESTSTYKGTDCGDVKPFVMPNKK
jgi:Protein of unknown function (DUF3617)